MFNLPAFHVVFLPISAVLYMESGCEVTNYFDDQVELFDVTCLTFRSYKAYATSCVRPDYFCHYLFVAKLFTLAFPTLAWNGNIARLVAGSVL